MLSIQSRQNDYSLKSKNLNNLTFEAKVRPELTSKVSQKISPKVKKLSVASLCASFVAVISKLFSANDQVEKKVKQGENSNVHDKMIDFIMTDCPDGEDISSFSSTDFFV